MERVKYKKKFKLIFASSIFLLCLWIYIVGLYEKNLKVNEYITIENEFISDISNLELSLSRTSTFIYGLRAFVYSQIESGEKNLSQEPFDIYSKKVQQSTNSVINFSIAPSNIQKYVYPLVGNEITLGYNLDDDERVNVINDLRKARSTKDTVISKPYDLRQGGVGIIVRDPIFTNGKYWGLTNVVIDFNDVVSRSNIVKENHNIKYTIYKSNGEKIFGKDYDVNESFKTKISFINEIWIVYGYNITPIESSEVYIYRLNYFKIMSFLILLFATSFISINIYRNMILSDKVKDMIYNDLLTQLPNRRALAEKMDKLIVSQKKFAVIFFDLDNFKNINDILGHSIGDKVLVDISTRLKHFQIDEIDDLEVFRWGGDEFIIINHNYNDDKEVVSHTIAIVDEIKKPIMLLDKEYKVSASIGISFYPNDGEEIEVLLKNADIAMYQAKKSGKDTVRLYNEKIGKYTAEIIELERNLSHSLENEELKVFYQPKIDMLKNQVIGAEALVRWFYNGNLIGPDKFIPIAEANGFIVKIDKFVLKETIKFISAWNDKGIRLNVSCNISAQQFNEEIYLIIKEYFQIYKLYRGQLEIEITESTAIENFIYAKKIIDSCKEIGVGVSLDDFGTGYSSLSYLSKLKISTLKIDRSFINKLKKNNSENKIVKAIIGLAKDIEINLIAEGVEDKDQVDSLISLGCHICQGFYYSKAMSSQEFETYYYKNKKNDN